MTESEAVAEVTVDPLPAEAAPPVEEAPVMVHAPGKPPRPLLGPSVWVSGVLLWSHVVMGIFTTTRLPFTAKKMPLDEGLAGSLVLAATGAAALFAVKRSLEITGGEPGPRIVRISLGAILLWTLYVFGAMVLGVVGFPERFVTFLLILFSGFSVWNGRRLTNRGLARPDGNRLVAIALWIFAAVVTVNALLMR